MEFEWNKYKLTTKLKFDSPDEYILILSDQEKILITYKSSILIFNIKSLKKEGEINFDNIKKYENLYLLKSGLISICSKNTIILIELNKDNTYKIFQRIEFPEIEEEQDFKQLIELKNSNLCIISKKNIYIYSLDNNIKNYKNIFTLMENCIKHKTNIAYNESCIELIYPEKNIENRIAVYLSNVSLLSFWDLNKRKKINNTKDNYCNTFDCKDMFCLMEKGKYLLCACIDEAIKFYSTETCNHIKTLYDNYWHISVLKLSEKQILSGGDFGDITLYEFDFSHDLFKNGEPYLSMEDTKKVEKKVYNDISKDFQEKSCKLLGHEKAINEIRKYGETIISTSCYEENESSFVCFWNKE